MKRCWKWFGILITVLVLVFFLAIIAVIVLVNPNQFKPLITSEAKQHFGLDVKIPGNLSWTFFPHLGVEVDEMEIMKPAQFTSNMKHVVLRVKFAPLLHRQLEFSKANLSQLTFNQLRASKVKARVSFKEQVLTFHPLTAVFYQGSLRTETRVSLKQAVPAFQITGELKNIDLPSLIKDLSGGKSGLVFDAKGNLSADLSTVGNTRDALLSHLNGKGRLSIDKGVIKGVDIGFYVDTAAALVNKQPLPARSPGNETNFGQLTATAVIKNGIMYNDDLLIDSPLYTTKGVGTVNLLNKTMDYRLAVAFKAGKAEDKIPGLGGKPIPIRVSGTLSNPKVALDTFALMQEIGKEQLQRVEEKIKEALPEKANKFLQNLFH